MSTAPRTVLVTGANSGLGFVAAARFAELGYTRVILATRKATSGAEARARLVEQVGRDPFWTVTVDLSDPRSIDAAVATLSAEGQPIDALLLNAGMVSGAELIRTDEGIERSMAATVTGHHRLTIGLLEAGLLATDARIVIAGSEAARGDIPTFAVTDVPQLAEASFGGDRVATITAIARAEPPYPYRGTDQYAMVKLVAAWWADALSRRLPAGMAAFAVSPGSAPRTNAGRHQGWFMRTIVFPIVAGPLGRALGLSQSVETAAERYVDAMEWGVERSGQFWASKPGKATGPVQRMEHPHIVDPETTEAAWEAICGLTGVDVVAREANARVTQLRAG